MIDCACGCGKKIEEKDRYGRTRRYISGHNGRKYKDPTQHKREWNYRNRKKRLESKSERGHRLKVKLIKIFGGECQNCKEKYNGKNACIFQFHHLKNKLIPITVRTVCHYSWKKMLRESKKCRLVCANCHFLIHGSKY